jgi:L-2,4-diaminobutyric acid acetyltransferase
VGCVTGYRRPDAPDTLFVWQVAVDPSARRRGLAGAMVSWLLDAHLHTGGLMLEATVTPGNTASRRLFEGVGSRRAAPVAWSPLIGPELLGDGHDAEDLVRVGPIV